MDYVGERDLGLPAYRTYLITKYHIERDILTERFPAMLDQANSMEEALACAHEVDAHGTPAQRNEVIKDALVRRQSSRALG